MAIDFGGSCAMNFSRRALNAAGSGTRGAKSRAREEEARRKSDARRNHFGFWILDFGLQVTLRAGMAPPMQNPKPEIDSPFRDERPWRRQGHLRNRADSHDAIDALPVRLEKPAHRHPRGRLFENVGPGFVDLGEERLPDRLADRHASKDDVR